MMWISWVPTLRRTFERFLTKVSLVSQFIAGILMCLNLDLMQSSMQWLMDLKWYWVWAWNWPQYSMDELIDMARNKYTNLVAKGDSLPNLMSSRKLWTHLLMPHLAPLVHQLRLPPMTRPHIIKMVRRWLVEYPKYKLFTLDQQSLIRVRPFIGAKSTSNPVDCMMECTCTVAPRRRIMRNGRKGESTGGVQCKEEC